MLKIKSLILSMLFFSLIVSCSNNSKKISDYATSESKIYRRAVESIIYTQPLVATHQTREAIIRAGGNYNSIAYISKPANWKWRILTPNNQVLYVAILTNTAKDGPVVIELPDSKSGPIIAGGILDSYQDPLVDVGLGGDDKGNGGKYLLFKAKDKKRSPKGFLPVRSERNIAWTMLRIVPKSFEKKDLDKAISLIKKIKVYPYSKRRNKPKQHFMDVHNKVFDTVLPLDSNYFDIMARMLNEETVTDIDKAFLGMMQTIGYKRGQKFTATDEMRKILNGAMDDAKEEIMKGVSEIAKPYWEGSPWAPLGREPTFSTGFSFITDSLLDYELRGHMYSYVCCGGIKLGTSTNLYLQTSKDANGDFLDGGETYKFTVPANAPVTQFWSLMAYDARTAVFFEDAIRPGLSSLDKRIVPNPDGSKDIYIGPKAPEGKKAHWIPTKPGTTPILLFRLYGVTERAKNGSWSAPGLVKQ